MLRNPHPTSERERGVALIVALLFTLVVAATVAVGTLSLHSHHVETQTSFLADGQALQTARSGLSDSLGWLRRQTSQPVLHFSPVLDPLADPPVYDTLDPDIGIVREFKITGSLWARYEVWKDWPADPDPARFALRQQYSCRDISLVRGSTSVGAVWLLRSVGFVYLKQDDSLPYDQLPNRVLASEFIETEARRLVLNLPGQSALNVRNGGSASININGRIYGGSTAAGIYYPQATGTPSTGPFAEFRVTGTPSLSTTVTYQDSYEVLFGLSLTELKAMATYVVTAPSGLPTPLLGTPLVVVESPSIVFDSANPLSGNGIVIAIGNVTIQNGSNSNFSGLLYVQGNLTMRAPSEIRGAVVCTGSVVIQGSPDYATVFYDQAALDALQQAFGSYGFSNTRQLPRRSAH